MASQLLSMIQGVNCHLEDSTFLWIYLSERLSFSCIQPSMRILSIHLAQRKSAPSRSHPEMINTCRCSEVGSFRDHPHFGGFLTRKDLISFFLSFRKIVKSIHFVLYRKRLHHDWSQSSLG